MEKVYKVTFKNRKSSDNAYTALVRHKSSDPKEIKLKVVQQIRYRFEYSTSLHSVGIEELSNAIVFHTSKRPVGYISKERYRPGMIRQLKDSYSSEYEDDIGVEVIDPDWTLEDERDLEALSGWYDTHLRKRVHEKHCTTLTCKYGDEDCPAATHTDGIYYENGAVYKNVAYAWQHYVEDCLKGNMRVAIKVVDTNVPERMLSFDKWYEEEYKKSDNEADNN